MSGMGRLVSAGAIVYSQLDFYNPAGSITRVTGVVVSDLTSKLFVNNVLMPWPLQDGTLVPDSSIAAGTVYFNETSPGSTFYSLRFFPDRTGFWRILLADLGLGVERILEYDVIPAVPSSGASGGLNASFVKQ